MRDALDQVTAELPGLPPRPARRALRLSHAQRRELAGYVPPKEVESCRTCRHVVFRAAELEREAFACKRHGFPVMLGAICDDYFGRAP